MIDRIKTNVMTAYHKALTAAQNWANVADTPIYVVSNGGRYFIADAADLACYHQRDIENGDAEIVGTCEPRIPAFGMPLDVDFTPVGWPV